MANGYDSHTSTAVKIAHIEEIVFAIRETIMTVKDDLRVRYIQSEKQHDDLEHRLRVLEIARNRIFGAAAGIGAVSGLLISALFWLLKNST